MPSHHAQTALRYLENEKYDDGARAVTHAQLETAAQIERIADMLDTIGGEMTNAFNALSAFVMSGGLARLIPQVKIFNPEDN